MNLTLPLPPRSCAPNGNKGSWRAKHTASGIYYAEAWGETLTHPYAERAALAGKRLTISLTFCTKGARGTGRYAPRDHDNATASFKAAQDGICKALGVSDSHTWLQSGGVTIDTTRGPFVEVSLEVTP